MMTMLLPQPQDTCASLTPRPQLAVPDEPRQGTEVLHRACLILMYIIQADRPVTTAEIRREFGLSYATGYRTLQAMADYGLVLRPEKPQGYRPGLMFGMYLQRMMAAAPSH